MDDGRIERVKVRKKKMQNKYFSIILSISCVYYKSKITATSTLQYFGF